MALVQWNYSYQGTMAKCLDIDPYKSRRLRNRAGRVLSLLRFGGALTGDLQRAED